jgi:hypothetical protein
MKKQIIKTLALTLVVTGVIFSCKKKDTAAPETAATTSTTGGTTGGTTGSTTGSTVTNTLTLNTWKLFDNASVTYTVANSAPYITGGNFAYGFANAGADEVRFFFKTGSVLPATGTYTVVDNPIATTASSNQVSISAAGSGYGYYSKAIYNATISVVNTNSVLTIVSTNVPLQNFLNASVTKTLSTNLQK